MANPSSGIVVQLKVVGSRSICSALSTYDGCDEASAQATFTPQSPPLSGFASGHGSATEKRKAPRPKVSDAFGVGCYLRLRRNAGMSRSSLSKVGVAGTA